MLADFFRFLLAEPDEGILHRIAGALEVMCESPCISDQSRFVVGHRLLDKRLEVPGCHAIGGFLSMAPLINARLRVFIRKTFGIFTHRMK